MVRRGAVILVMIVLTSVLIGCTDQGSGETAVGSTTSSASVVTDLEAEIERLELRIQDLEEELASVSRERDRLVGEQEGLVAAVESMTEAFSAEIAEYEERLTSMRSLASVPDDPAVQEAVAALRRFLEAMRAGRFAEAHELYGGSYEELASWNPTADPEDEVALLEAGCLQLRCDLEVSRVLPGDIDPPRFEFYLEFTAAGEQFARGPCCGDDSGAPPETQFPFVVEQTPDGPDVLTLPVYVP